jgi:hypothetical protein
VRVGAEQRSKLSDEAVGGRRRAAQQGHQVPVPVHVVAGREARRGDAGPVREVAGKGRKKGWRLPRKRREGVPVELGAPEADEVGPVAVGGGAQDRRPVGQLLVDRVPVHLVQAGTVAPHGDHALVPLRKRVGDGVGEACAKVVAALLRTVHLQDGKRTVFNRPPRVLVEGLGHLPILRVVLPHEPLVLPLPLGAVAEEQDDGLVAGRADGRGALGETNAKV